MNKNDGGFFRNLITCILCVIIVVILLKDAKYLFTGDAKDINQMIENGEELKVGEHVSIEVTYVVDWYAELTQRGRRTGTKITYHALAVLDSGKIISLSAKKDSAEYNKIDNLVDDTYDYITGVTYSEPITVKFTGTVRKIDSEISGYYREALTFYGYSPSGDAYMLDIDTSQERIFGILGLIVASVLALLFGFFTYGDYLEYKEKKAARIKALNEPVSVKLDNDPIFNSNFYATYKPQRQMDVKSDPISDVDSTIDDNPDTDVYKVDKEEAVKDEQDELKPTYSSKFTLKKD